MFVNSDDAFSKIGKCVVSYKEEPVYVNMIQGKGDDYKVFIRGVAQPDTSASYQEVPLNHRDLDFKNLGDFIGYNNQYETAVYVSRMPVRKTIYGLRGDNINCTPIKVPASPSYPTGGKQVRFESLLTPDFLKMWQGEFPTIKNISQQFETNPDLKSRAFQRKFAVNKKDIGPFFLEYRGRDIGWSDDISKFTLDRSFRYLTETLEFYGVDFK